MKPDKIIAVDCTWLMHRAFHVRPQSIPYMVFGWVCQFAVTRQATHVVCCFDTGKSFRKDLFDGYKGNRGKSGVSEYMPLTTSLFDKASIGCLFSDGFEADDLLATIGAYSSPTCLVEMVTPDKDNYQCISDTCSQLRPGVSGKEDVLWGKAKLAQEFRGLTPRQFLDYQTLLGDGTDAIPQLMTSVASIKVIQKHGSLKKYLQSPAGVIFTEEVGASNINLNRKLVKLVTNCIEFDHQYFSVKAIKPGLNFKSEWYAQLTSKKKTLF